MKTNNEDQGGLANARGNVEFSITMVVLSEIIYGICCWCKKRNAIL